MYNAENRPVRWTQGAKVITMAFDRLGRRVSYREMNGATQVAHTVFLYNGYLCIQQLFSNSPWNVYKEFIWDPTEPVATRPLAFRQYGKTATFLMHDGNKNVTDVVTVGPANTPVAHIDYAPFGAATLSGTRASDNPFRFSSEYHDDTLGLVYYNYRHYNPTDGRWTGRDLIDEQRGEKNLFSFCKNGGETKIDYCGLSSDELTIIGYAYLYHTRMFGIDWLGGASFSVTIKCSESGDWTVISKGRSSSDGSEMTVEKYDFGLRVHYDGSGRVYPDLVPVAILGAGLGSASVIGGIVASGAITWLGQKEWTIRYEKSISVTCQCQMVGGERKYNPTISTTESLIKHTPQTRDFNLKYK